MRYQHPHGHVFYRKMNHARPQIERGEGVYLYDQDGNRYLDGSGGPMVVNVGHSRTDVIEAMNAQARRAGYVHAIMFTNEAVETYASAMSAYIPIPDARLFFLSSGSEVIEGAIKLAREIQLARGETERSVIISRSQSYHGMTIGALASSGREALRQPYLPLLPNRIRIAPPYPYRDPADGREAADRLEAAIVEAGPEKVAAFLAEPISGTGLGAVVPDDAYWPRIREICDRYGVLLITDEVLVGMGRTGRWWGIEHWDVRPDILVTSKGVAGGYVPFGFLAASGEDVEQIRRELGDFNHGGTFSHHPVAAAAALSVLRIYEREQLVERSARLGRYLHQRIRDTLGDHPHVGEIRGRGLYCGLELVQDRQTRAPFPQQEKRAWHIWERAFELGLVIYYATGCVDGSNGDLLLIGPPLIIDESEIDELVEKLDAAVRAELGG
jgi:adenosylmethionine-8-amino-7-oxononanoate aminotransferase